SHHHRAVLPRRRQHQQQPHNTASYRVSESIEPHIDNRLGRTLFGWMDWCVKELVTSAEKRVSKHRLSGSGRSYGSQARSEEPAEPTEEQCGRRRGRGSAQSELLQDESAGSGLSCESDQARRRVVEGEEAEERLSPFERGNGLHLEQVFGQTRPDGSKEHDSGEKPEVWSSCEDLEAGAGRFGCQIGRHLDRWRFHGYRTR